MASHGDAAPPPTRRSRKSIAVAPTTATRRDKDNATSESSDMAAARKKSRSKSMGPGGFDALKSGTGNRRASLAVFTGPPPKSILKPTLPPLPDIPAYRPKPGEGTKVALRTEEEQQAAAREREERERAALEREIAERREARRKSLANRRVSFAAEATLHTFHEIEMQDSTTSTESSRRASSVASQSPGQHPSSDADPSTPNERSHDYSEESPADSRRRRSSGVGSTTGNDSESGAGDQTEDDGTSVLSAEEMSFASLASPPRRATINDDDLDDSLEENLRLAVRRATLQTLDDDEEAIAGFGWGRKHRENITSSQGAKESEPASTNNHEDKAEDGGSNLMDMETGMEMDMTNAMGKILSTNANAASKAPSPPKEDEDEEMDEGMSMDVTAALGGILDKAKAFLRRKSFLPDNNPQSEGSENGEQTMEFTTAVGGIRDSPAKHPSSDGTQAEIDANEEMSMEFTAAVGGLLGANFLSNAQNFRRRTMAADIDDNDTMMDFTGVSRLLPGGEDDEEEDEPMEETGMDMTTAVGGIIKPSATPEARTPARKGMDREGSEPASVAPTPAEKPVSYPKLQSSQTVPDNSLAAFQGKGLRRTPPRALSPGRESAQPSSSPMRQTPSPQRTAAKPRQRQSPTRSSPRRTGSSSPMRLSPSPAKTTPRATTQSKLFRQDPHTGLNTPRVILTPQGRRLSGQGADRPGLGSPRVAEIIDRRSSIGEAAEEFVPTTVGVPGGAGAGAGGKRMVAFTDPRVMEEEIEKEKEDQEMEGKNIREMISGLSPKKNNPLRGRKSLHVGSAVGLLGKRPKELDMDEEDEEGSEELMDGVKRLKGVQGSPVKNIRLGSPSGRRTRQSIMPGGDATTPMVPNSPQRATTSKGRGVDDHQQPPTMDLQQHHGAVNEAEVQQAAAGDGEQRIHLQDFLNMTGIHFMELTATKRRHTTAPNASKDGGAPDPKDVSLERCVVAGACIVPQLEMYQHACRELKKYISEGRRIIKEIEVETYEDNPPLFREYMNATPEVKALMDNQFKNVKTHARLLSKAMWYEWRTKLMEGLKEGLLKTAEGMDNDDKLLKRQEELIASVLPDMVKRYNELEAEKDNLEAVAQELADTDPKDLEDARNELLAVDKAIQEKAKKLEEMRRELEESDKKIEQLTQQKQQYLEEIREADRIREQYRGWSAGEIAKLKESIERHHGWAVLRITNNALLTLRYKRELTLTFDIVSPSSTTPTIDFLHSDTIPPPEKAFFLHHLRAHIARHAPWSDPKRLIAVVAAGWDRALQVAEYVRRLRLSFPTTTAVITPSSSEDSDSAVAVAIVTSSILLPTLRTRVEVFFKLSLSPSSTDDFPDVSVEPDAKVVYGEGFVKSGMVEFLRARVGKSLTVDDDKGWDEAVLVLRKRLLGGSGSGSGSGSGKKGRRSSVRNAGVSEGEPMEVDG